jgi:hypothetical protein
VTGENLLSSGTASAVMSTLLSLSKRCTVEWLIYHPTVRLGNGKLDAVTELHRVNLSPEN